MQYFSLKFEAKKLHQQLAVFLQLKRHESDLTMRELAAIIELSHSYIGKIERYNRRVDVGEFIHYCRAMKLDPARELQAFLENAQLAQD